MKIAYILFDGMTTMDFAGVHEAVPWMLVLGAQPDLKWDFCAVKEEIVDDRGLRMTASRVRPDLSEYDVVFFTGGMPTRELRYDEAFVAWLRTAKDVKLKASVCTGALLLGGGVP